MKNMKAVRIHSYGGPEVLAYEDVPQPVPGPGEVLVRVHAAGVNPVDWKIRAGYMKEFLPHTFPLTLGWDLSGVVEAAGPGSAYRGGEEVFAMSSLMRNGSYAEYIVIDEALLAAKPKSQDHAHAAAVPLAGLTAHIGLFEFGELRPGQKVLIHGGAGGVGTLAVQLAKRKGAYVIATASGKNQNLLRELGADEAVDYASTRFEEKAKDVDLVFDTIGGETLERSWSVLKKGGILVATSAMPSQEKAAALGVKAKYVSNRPDARILKELAELMDAGKLHSFVEAGIPLAEVRKAHVLSQAGHVRGKIVLTVA